MPCLLLLLILFFPRVVLVVLGLFTRYFGDAYPHWKFLVPLSGFIFAPLTTCVYALIVVNSYGPQVNIFSHPLTTTQLIIVVVALIIDLSGWGGGFRSRRR